LDVSQSESPRGSDRPNQGCTVEGYLKDTVLDTYLKDNVNARELRSDGKYERIKPLEGQKRFDSQLELENAGFNSVRL